MKGKGSGIEEIEQESGGWCLWTGKPVGGVPQWWKQGLHSGCTGPWFLQLWKVLGCSTNQATGNPRHTHYVAGTVPCPSSMFLAASTCLSFVSLWMAWDQSRSFLQYAESPRKLVAHPVRSFPVKATLSSQEFALGAVQCQPGGWNIEEREALRIFRIFVTLCYWIFLSGILSFPRDIFVLEHLSNYWSCVRTEAVVS